jgi:hypothetical protein
VVECDPLKNKNSNITPGDYPLIKRLKLNMNDVEPGDEDFRTWINEKPLRKYDLRRAAALADRLELEAAALRAYVDGDIARALELLALL